MEDHQDRIGQQVGEYRLLHLLGRGTFGVVYLAEQVHEHSQVAIKLLQMQLSRGEDLKDFLNEARIIRLHHPHIVPLLDFGISRDGLPYLVMEYAAGGTLRERYPRGTQLPLATIMSYATQLASALQYAHDRHMIHRDIKPENMLLRADGTVLLSDFGIARVLEQSASASLLTQAGTPAYMSPEQSQGHPSPASDQYALAVVIYEWIAGLRPFQGAPIVVVVQHRLDAPPSLTALRTDLPKEIEQVVFQALAKKPEERFATIEQFAQALQAAIQGAPTMTPKQSVPSTPSPEPSSFSALPLSVNDQATSQTAPALSASPRSGTEHTLEAPEETFFTAEQLGVQTILPSRPDTGHPLYSTVLVPEAEMPARARPRVAPAGRVVLLVVLALLITGSGALVFFALLPKFSSQSLDRANTVTTGTIRMHPTTIVAGGTPQAHLTTTITHTGQASLGVRVTSVDATLVKADNLSIDYGVLIVSVTAHGPAAMAGLQAGDVIVQFNGQTMKDVNALAAALGNENPGDRVPVQVYRGSQLMTVNVILGTLLSG